MEPTWQSLQRVKVEARPVGLWGLASAYVPGSRLLRFKVISTDEQGNTVPTVWSPVKGTNCEADGLISVPAKLGLLSMAAMYGALIGKVGGSSADLPDSSSPGAPYGNKRVFPVGSYCVISIGSAEGGPLFLTMNDSPDGFAQHSGTLQVLIEEHSL